MADRDKQNSATQDESSLGGAQLPGSEFLPEKNALPSMPNIQSGDPDIQPGVPEFDNNYMQSNYSNLNDREANEARYERNKADALKQKQASSEMVDTINRGTKAMAEVRQMRSGKADGQLPGFGVMNEPAGMVGSGLGSAGYSTEDAIPEKPQVKNQLGEKRLNFDKNKYLQEEANKSNRRTGNPKDALSSDLWASVQSERDPNKKSFLMKQLQSKTGFSYEQLMDYVKKITQPRLDDDPFIGLNNNL